MQHIAVVGASGSGKSWLATRLATALGHEVQIDDAPAVKELAPSLSAVLLMGLDLGVPLPAQVREDQDLRQSLARQQHAFQVIYGQGDDRLAHALEALKVAQPSGKSQEIGRIEAEAPPKRKPWVWSCEKCSDPICEHRLLSDLIAKR